MMKKSRKGFTIVELVIVIAVIAVLAAVLIPTFIHLVNKANRASDESLVTNLNKALAMREQEPGDTKNNTMHDAVLDLEEEGYKLSQLLTKSDQKLLWNDQDNRFCLEDAAAQDKAVHYWQIVKEIPAEQKYSLYAGHEWEAAEATGLKVGFDAGFNTIQTVEYKRTGDAGQEVAIRTNASNLTIEAEKDTVKHYGDAVNVTVKKIASDSYHLFGEASGRIILEDGRAVIEKGAVAGTLEVAKGAEKVQVVEGGKVGNVTINEDADITGSNIVVENNAEVTIVVNNSESVDTSALAGAGVKVVETKSDAAQGKAAYNIGKGTYLTNLGAISSSGDYLLLKDYSGPVVPAVLASKVTLDLNGHTITSSDASRGVINAARAGYYFEVKGTGKLVQTSTDSNAPAIISKSENLKVGAGVQIEGGAVGIWVEGTSKAFTVDFAGTFKTTLPGSFGFYRNGTNKDVVKCPTINIKKTAKVEVTDGAAIYGAGYAIWNIEGGEFTSNECLEFKSGVITISGGKFKTTATSHVHVPNSNGTSGNGYALAMIYNSGYAKPLTVTLKGGEFTGPVSLLSDNEPGDVSQIVFDNQIGVQLTNN